MLAILDSCQLICADISSRSQEAARVARALTLAVQRLKTFVQSENYASKSPNQAATSHRSSTIQNQDESTISSNTSTYNIPSDTGIPLTASTSIHHHQTTITQPYVQSWRHGANLPDSAIQSNQFGKTKDTDHESSRIIESFSTTMTDDMFLDIDLIDWTQFDQFTGFLNHEAVLDTSTSEAVDATHAIFTGTSPIDYAEWDSTPVFSLGARSRDPVTGKTVMSDS